MDWISNIGFSAAGLPWWAAFILILLTWFATKGVDAALKWRRANMEERQYEAGEAKTARDALVEELRRQVGKLIVDVQSLTKMHLDAQTAHVNCQLEQEKLRGEMNVMKVELARLKKHDQNNEDNVNGLKQAVAQIDPAVASKLLQ